MGQYISVISKVTATLFCALSILDYKYGSNSYFNIAAIILSVIHVVKFNVDDDAVTGILLTLFTNNYKN